MRKAKYVIERTADSDMDGLLTLISVLSKKKADMGQNQERLNSGKEINQK